MKVVFRSVCLIKIIIVVELDNMKDKNGGKIDPSHLYIAGFWSTGGKPIVIANVSLAN